MTPKEKAGEIISKFNKQGVLIPWTAYLQRYSVAKQCALITVDEIISNQYDYTPKAFDDYWKEVRNEIEKL